MMRRLLELLAASPLTQFNPTLFLKNGEEEELQEELNKKE
jgi:hypothetical protein